MRGRNGKEMGHDVAGGTSDRCGREERLGVMVTLRPVRKQTVPEGCAVAAKMQRVPMERVGDQDRKAYLP